MTMKTWQLKTYGIKSSGKKDYNNTSLPQEA